ncbi:MAG: OmpA family protein [Sphingobacteriaceae bacterium]|nr:MAG: OmpA family protein [Sphingobacteriaceae bacterium]
MNYSTLKKTVVLSIASLMGVVAAHAQTSSDSTTTVVPGSSKVFGGRAQYRTWSIGANAGVLSPNIPFGSDDFNHSNLEFGYGVSIRKQLGHAFGLQLDGVRGTVSGDNSRNRSGAVNGARNGFKSFTTELGYSATLSGVANIATVDFLHRKNGVNFFVSAGAGLAAYAPKTTSATNVVLDYKDRAGSTGDKTYIHELVIPIGVGLKFKLSDGIALNLGYTANFIDGDNLDGATVNYPTKDKFSYGYGGLEFALGSKAKPNLDWVNPLAMMYDELKDPTLREEVEALKGRVSNVENAVNDLKKDTDGDGVADQFDKCPGTPAGTIVDGSGCEIKFPKPDTTMAATPGNYGNIQFEFDSSVLRTSAYPTLDKVSADLRSNTAATIELDGYASSEGSAAHNMRLSRDRANSVKTYLVNSGVDAKRIKTVANGETNPVADNSTEQGRVLNRRVEVKPAGM